MPKAEEISHIRWLEGRNTHLAWNWCLLDITGFWAFGYMYPAVERDFDPDDPEGKDSCWNDIVSSFKTEAWDKHAIEISGEKFLHTSDLAQWMKKNLYRQWKWDDDGEEA